MKNYKYLVIVAAVTVFAACSDDENEMNCPDSPVAAQISAGVSGPSTRAADNVWEQDEIGVMVTNAPASNMATLYKNVKYTTTATTSGAANFTSTNGIYFQVANETVTFAAYAPYQTSAANALPGDDSDGIIKGSTVDQGDRTKQQAFDYIYASGATATRRNPTVEFKEANAFAHKMTRLVIIVKPGDDITESDITGGNYALSGLNHSGQFDITTGTAEATGMTLTDDWSLTDNSLMTAGETTQRTFTSILYPQTLATALTFTATIGGQKYVNNTDISPALAAGMSYEYTITVKKTGLTVSECAISAWSIVSFFGNSFEENYDVRVGDFYCSKEMYGINIGYVIPQEDVAVLNQHRCIGIVFYVGHHERDNANYTSTGINQEKCHGYVVALTDVPNICPWQWKSPNGFVGTSTTVTAWNGYSNHQQIRNFVNRTTGWKMEHFPAALACDTYGDWQKPLSAPNNTSGWFLPSISQLSVLDSNRSSLSDRMAEVKNSTSDDCSYKDYIEWFSRGSWYYSSTEWGWDRNGQVWALDCYNGTCDSRAKDAGARVRPVLAF